MLQLWTHAQSSMPICLLFGLLGMLQWLLLLPFDFFWCCSTSGSRWSWRRWRGRFSAAAAATIRRWLLCLVSVGGEHICNWCYRISPHLMAAHLHLITGTQIQRHFRLSLENPDWMNVFSGNLIESYSKVCYESMISCSYFKCYQFHLLMSLAEIHTVYY